ncbi:unnamed protein product [Arabidopsis halleri]
MTIAHSNPLNKSQNPPRNCVFGFDSKSGIEQFQFNLLNLIEKLSNFNSIQFLYF